MKNVKLMGLGLLAAGSSAFAAPIALSNGASVDFTGLQSDAVSIFTVLIGIAVLIIGFKYVIGFVKSKA